MPKRRLTRSLIAARHPDDSVREFPDTELLDFGVRIKPSDSRASTDSRGRRARRGWRESFDAQCGQPIRIKQFRAEHAVGT